MSFLDTVFRYARSYNALKSRDYYNVLVIAPANALLHWYMEWDKWFRDSSAGYKCE